MDFKIKCLIQTVFSIIPFGVKLNYMCQKIFGRLPASYEKYVSKANAAKWRYEKYLANQKVSQTDVEKICYEFGAGWDLISPMLMSTYGFNRIVCSDIRQQMFPSLLNSTIEHMSVYLNNVDLKDKIGTFTFKNYIELLKNMNIEYLAPLDTQATTFSGSSIDFICTHVTLEHIPYEILVNIMNECYRILKPGGIMSHIIDYTDHWYYNDKNITCYNYFRYSDEEWKKYNPPIHYQNRLRNSDYRKIFLDAGFRIIEENTYMPTDYDFELLNTIPLSEKYKNYEINDLAIQNASYVLIKD